MTILVALVAAVLQAGVVAAAPAEGHRADPVNERVVRLQAELAAQSEARDRQADAFDAAVSRIEIVNGLLVVVIALAGIGGSLLAIRWVRSLARDQVAEQISSAVRDIGREIFKTDSADLCAEYDKKFADLYKQYHELVEAEQ